MKPHSENPLWPLLVEAAHALLMYKPHKNYTRHMILPTTPSITDSDLSGLLGIPIGEAMVILHELGGEKMTPLPAQPPPPPPTPQKTTTIKKGTLEAYESGETKVNP